MKIPFLKYFSGKNLPDNLGGNRGWEFLDGLIRKWVSNWKSSDQIWADLTDVELELAYGANPIVFSCVNALMRAVSQVRFEIGMWNKDDEWEPIVGHPLLDVLEYPNDSYSRNDFMQYWTSRFVLTGFSAVWKFRDGGNRLSQLWPVPTSWVTPVKGSGMQLISGYRIHGQSGIVPAKDISIARIIDPSTTVGHIAPLNAAGRDFRLDIERNNYLVEMLVNMKLPSLIVSSEKPLTAEQLKDVRETLEARVGPGKRGNALVLPGNSKAEAVAPLRDLDWPGLTALIETRICAALGVPPIVVNLRSGLDRATYSNYEQAKRAMYTGTVGPICDVAAASFTLGFLRAEGDKRLEFRARYDELPEFQEDKNATSERTVKEYEAGIIDTAQARENLNYDPDPQFEKATDELNRQKKLLPAPTQPWQPPKPKPKE